MRPPDDPSGLLALLASAGRRVTRMQDLKQVYDRQLDGEISTLEEGLAYTASLLV